MPIRVMQRRRARSAASALPSLALGVAATLVAASSSANPRPLPMSYVYETLGAGEAELETYVDATPLRGLSSATGEPIWHTPYRVQAELEYGVTDRLELGLYVQLVPTAGESVSSAPTFTEGNGVKQRLRVRLGEAGEWPLDVSLYGELVELQNEIEVEAKLIVQRRFGAARLVANAWVERELYFDGRKDWTVNGSGGVTAQITPSLHLGAEYWVRKEIPDVAPAIAVFNNDAHHFLGPALLVSFGRLWWSVGAYARLDAWGRAVQVGDSFGHVWVRSVVGVSL